MNARGQYGHEPARIAGTWPVAHGNEKELRAQYGGDDYIPVEYREGRKRQQWDRMTWEERWTARKDEHDALLPDQTQASPRIWLGFGIGVVGLIMFMLRTSPRTEIPVARVIKK